MTAAIAVLNVQRPMSFVTLSIAQCAFRRAAVGSPRTSDGAAAVVSATSVAIRHRRDRKRWMPPTPSSDQSASWSGGPR
jgi:hypothetical protein